MRLSQRMIVGFLAISVFSAIVGYVGFISMSVVNDDFRGFSSQNIPVLGLLKDIKATALEVVLSTIEISYIQDRVHAKEEMISREEAKSELRKSTEVYGAQIDAYFPEESGIKEDIKEKSDVLLNISDKMVELKMSNASESEIVKTDKAFEKAEQELSLALEGALKHEEGNIQAREASVKTTIERSRISIVIIIIVSVLSAILSGFIFARSIADPVIELTKASAGIGRNYATLKKLEPKSDDEIGELTNSFNDMINDVKNRDEEISGKNKELEKSKKELEQKVGDLERFNKLAVGRELKMIELKKRIKELEGKAI